MISWNIENKIEWQIKYIKTKKSKDHGRASIKDIKKNNK
jgi:hypothetical protein